MARSSKVPRREVAESWDDIAESIEEHDDNEYDSPSYLAEEGSPKSAGSHVNRVGTPPLSNSSSSPNSSIPSGSAVGSGPRKTARKSIHRQLLGPADSSPLSGPRRRSARNSRAPSLGAQVPQFIYPQVDGSWIDADSPSAHSRRRRIPKVIEGSEDEAEQQTQASPSARRGRRPAADDTSNPFLHIFQFAWTYFAGPVLHYLGEILRLVLQWLAPLVAAVVAICLTLFVLQLAVSKLIPSFGTRLSIFESAASPCSLPLLSSLPFCQNTTATGRPEFEELVKVQASFEDVLQSAARGAELPLDMKRSEAGIRDLRYLVAYSNLPSKNELVYVFEEFISTARLASADLTKFNSRINRATDHIISTNRYTLQVLDGYTEYEQSRGAVDRLLSKVSLSSPRLTEASILQQYLRHAEAVENEIVALIDQAQVLLTLLQGLDNQLDAIAGICARDGVRLQSNLDDLFALLWTRLGGNRASKHKIDTQLQLLRDVGAYRRLAWAHITGTILKLQQIQAGLEDLRERVVMPDTLPDIPLEQHIATIQLGVQRLEEQRNEARRLETDTYRRIMDKPDELDRSKMVEGAAK